MADPLVYPLDQVIYTHLLPLHDGVLVHAAGIVSDGAGLVLAGVSGAGKSTTSRIADAAGMRVLSDDRVVLRRVDGTWRMYGTPWPGDAGFARNEGVPLKALLFLRKALENRSEPVDAAGAMERLMPVSSIPWYEPTLMSASLGVIGDLAASIPAADLSFTPDDRVLPALRAAAV